jgi:hypothetical protein
MYYHFLLAFTVNVPILNDKNTQTFVILSPPGVHSLSSIFQTFGLKLTYS